MNNYKSVKLNLARNALRYVIRAFKIKELYFPYYICPSVRISALKENVKLIFYHIDSNFYPVDSFPCDAFILYPNYFGICNKIVDELSKKYSNIIIDNAHSFFSEPKGIASFNSLRKFFPKLQNGSFLYIRKTADIHIEKDNFKYENKEYISYEDLCRNENRLDKEDIKYMSDYTLSYFSSIDLNTVQKKFLNNFNKYHKKYGRNNILNIKLSDNIIPYKYPYLASTKSEADKTVKELNEQGKIIFRYWNNLPESYSEKILYTNLIAI